MPGTRTFTYSAENQLLTVLSAGQTIKYSYGPAARRVRTKIDGVITHFTHAGAMEIAEYDNSGNLLRRYIPGPGVDQRVLMVICGTSSNCRPNQAGTDTQYYFADRLGNVLAVTDNTGAIEQRYFYTPFGVEMQGDETGNPFRYTGRRYDAETGLYYYRARYYDADLGRFLQVDPIGYADQYNLYAYVGNNPLTYGDPMGTDMWDFRDGFMAATVGNEAIVRHRKALDGRSGGAAQGRARNVERAVGIGFDLVRNDPGMALQAGLMLGTSIGASESADFRAGQIARAGVEMAALRGRGGLPRSVQGLKGLAGGARMAYGLAINGVTGLFDQLEAAGVPSSILSNDQLGQIVAGAASGLDVSYNAENHSVDISGTYNRTGSRIRARVAVTIELPEQELEEE